MGVRYVRQEPYVDDYGIFVPVKTCVPEGCACEYNCLITKEMFIEAYNKWIKNEHPFYGQDDADCWSDD